MNITMNCNSCRAIRCQTCMRANVIHLLQTLSTPEGLVVFKQLPVSKYFLGGYSRNL